MFQKGDRVEFVWSDDPFTRLRPGALGTVSAIDGLGTVHVAWDSGSRLGMVVGTPDVPGPDEIELASQG